MNVETRDILDETIQFDPETGELLEDLGNPIVISAIPQVTRWMLSYQRKLEEVEKYRKEEVDRINSICEHKALKMHSGYNSCMLKIESLMKEAGEQKVSYPGLGSFSWRAGSTVIDTTGWDDVQEGQRKALAFDYPGLFTTTITPKKTPLRVAMQANEFPSDGAPFKLETKSEKFTFKSEA